MSETNERRQMGAMIGVLRDDKVLVVQDKPKKWETAANLPWLIQTKNSPIYWSLPGGGRDKLDGREELLRETLERELREEIGIVLPLLETDLQLQACPFFIAQIKSLIDSKKIDVFAATTARVQFDSFSSEIQKLIADATRENYKLKDGLAAQWIEIDTLLAMYSMITLTQEYSKKNVFRPQTIAAAQIWHLEELGKEYVTQQIQGLNNVGYRLATKTAREVVMMINNGAYDENGNFREDFSEADATYLNLKRNE